MAKKKINLLARAAELGFIVIPKRELPLFSAWYKGCLRLAWPCVSVIRRGRYAEVKFDAFTTRRQGVSRAAGVAVRDVVTRWSERLRERGIKPPGWFGPVCFGVDGVPPDDDEQLAGEMLAAAREADPVMFSRPRTDDEYRRRVGFIEAWETMAAQEDAGSKRKIDIGRAAAVAEVIHESPPPSTALTKKEWDALVISYGGACAYCERTGMLMLKDQLVPAVRGGEHRIGNVVPACIDCNGRKAGRVASDFIAASSDLPAHRLREAFGIPVPPPAPRAKRKRR